MDKKVFEEITSKASNAVRDIFEKHNGEASIMVVAVNSCFASPEELDRIPDGAVFVHINGSIISLSHAVPKAIAKVSEGSNCIREFLCAVGGGCLCLAKEADIEAYRSAMEFLVNSDLHDMMTAGKGGKLDG